MENAVYKKKCQVHIDAGNHCANIILILLIITYLILSYQ